MSQTVRLGDLEIAEDMEFQKKEWMVQRIGWVIGLLLLLVALGGLLGPGWLSDAQAADGAFQVQYNRFLRYKSPTDFVITLDPEAASNGTVALWFERDYLSSYQIDHILPQPDTTRFSGDRVIYEFQIRETGEPVSFKFELTTQGIGSYSGQVGQENTDYQVEISNLVYP